MNLVWLIVGEIIIEIIVIICQSQMNYIIDVNMKDSTTVSLYLWSIGTSIGEIFMTIAEVCVDCSEEKTELPSFDILVEDFNFAVFIILMGVLVGAKTLNGSTMGHRNAVLTNCNTLSGTIGFIIIFLSFIQIRMGEKPLIIFCVLILCQAVICTVFIGVSDFDNVTERALCV